MLTQEDLKILREMMQEELKPIHKEISDIKADISEIKEDIKNIDTAIGMISEWADEVSVITKAPHIGKKNIV